ncbi:hypothetical protein [Spirosoma oryzicola]|uniref:hypothetical protein n=1 Tax=Spirosoma oryzicola TaxID=2898794 RepID=UPI001E2BC0DE|nr:hypothetical protein [Spirosoma oryzicola]UHG93316.1 hypothetical protein LQ777_10530 [Spirosoma oryzicola]
MKSFLLKSTYVMLAIVAAVLMADFVVPAAEAATHLLTHADPGSVVMGLTSLAALKNIDDQTPNPAGGRRAFVVLAADLKDDVIDWPKKGNITASELTVAIPLKVGKSMAIITPADNTLDATFESQGDRFYQSFKHSIMFDIAGNGKAQLVEAEKYVNAGVIFIVEENDDTMKVYGTKLQPIVLKQKGQLGKKGGDKKGISFSGDNDSYTFAPPIYPSTLALPLTPVVA